MHHCCVYFEIYNFVSMQGLFVPFAHVGSGNPYICYTTNMPDTIEAFIAETYVQLVTTKSMCYSTSCLRPCNCVVRWQMHAHT